MTTILVVDDEPEIRQVVRAYLEREGFAVLRAADGVGYRFRPDRGPST